MLIAMFDHFEELEGIQAEVRRVIGMLRENADELRATGFDVEEAIADIQDQFVQTVKTYVEADKAQDEYLHAWADIADAEAEYFSALCSLMDPLAGEQPDDVIAQQWQQLRPLLANSRPMNN